MKLTQETNELIEKICSSMLEEWKKECYFQASDENTGLVYSDFLLCREDVDDFMNNVLWEYESHIPLNVSLEIMSHHSAELEWDFFFTLTSSMLDEVKPQNYVDKGGSLFKQQALMLIAAYHLPTYLKNNLYFMNKTQLTNPTNEYYKNNRNDLYTRHPYK